MGRSASTPQARAMTRSSSPRRPGPQDGSRIPRSAGRAPRRRSPCPMRVPARSPWAVRPRAVHIRPISRSSRTVAPAPSSQQAGRIHVRREDASVGIWRSVSAAVVHGGHGLRSSSDRLQREATATSTTLDAPSGLVIGDSRSAAMSAQRRSRRAGLSRGSASWPTGTSAESPRSTRRRRIDRAQPPTGNLDHRCLIRRVRGPGCEPERTGRG